MALPSAGPPPPQVPCQAFRWPDSCCNVVAFAGFGCLGRAPCRHEISSDATTLRGDRIVRGKQSGDPAAPKDFGLEGSCVWRAWREVEPEGFTEESDGSITVEVHQVVHDARTGELISDSRVRHRYRLEPGLVTRMDVLEHPGKAPTLKSTEVDRGEALAWLFVVGVFTLYGTVVPFGAAGFVGFAVVGALWAAVLVWVSRRLDRSRHAEVARRVVLGCCVLGTGALAGAGILYTLMFRSVLVEPTTTYAVLSALMAPRSRSSSRFSRSPLFRS